jgi:hypothetical protein
MKQFLGKITLEQVINNAQVLLSSIAKKGGGGGGGNGIFNIYSLIFFKYGSNSACYADFQWAVHTIQHILT